MRDYRIHSAGTREIITGGSAFNIKAASLRMGDFTENAVAALLLQHTEETGQPFTPEAVSRIWEWTRGQPWLVNALAYELCFEIRENRDRAVTITADMAVQARENLIRRRETHLDQLADKLMEPRVRRILEPMLSGGIQASDLPEDDLQCAADLGLIRQKPRVVISNPIYKEIIPRMLTATTQDTLPIESPWYVAESGKLDMNRLMRSFQEFFRKHSESWVERFQYKEAGPQLLLQAFLQRIVNSNGRFKQAALRQAPECRS